MAMIAAPATPATPKLAMLTEAPPVEAPPLAEVVVEPLEAGVELVQRR